jgi:hypothetical protein
LRKSYGVAPPDFRRLAPAAKPQAHLGGVIFGVTVTAEPGTYVLAGFRDPDPNLNAESDQFQVNSAKL